MEEIKVKDIYLNAYLKSFNFSPMEIKIDDLDGRKTIMWIYKSEERLLEEIQNFRDSKFMKDFIRHYLFSKREINKILG